MYRALTASSASAVRVPCMTDHVTYQVGEVERLLEEASDLIDQIEVDSYSATGDQRKQVELLLRSIGR